MNPGSIFLYNGLQYRRNTISYSYSFYDIKQKKINYLGERVQPYEGSQIFTECSPIREGVLFSKYKILFSAETCVEMLDGVEKKVY